MKTTNSCGAWIERSFPVLLLILASLFLFTNLDDYLLWQDEANAALLGRNVLTYGVPRVFDGNNLLLFIHSDVDESLIWRLWGWLPLYTNALTYQVFGISTWGARLPYALTGLGFFAWAFFRVRMERPFWVAALFILLSVFSVPLLLHFRQCQYYGPSIVFTGLLFFIGQRDLARLRTRAAFVLASILLFHTHILIWMASMAASGARHVISALKGTSRLKDLVQTYLLALLFALPGAFIYRPWEFKRDHQTRLGVDALTYLKKAIFDFTNLVEPVYGFHAFAIMAIPIFLAFMAFRKSFSIRTGFPFVFCLVYFLFITLFSRNAYFRYFTPLIPVFFYGLVLLAEVLVSRKRVLGALFLATLLLTNVLQIRLSRTGEAYSLFGQFLFELTHQNSDVNEEIVDHLRENSRPTDVVFTNYGAFPIIYYTRLRVGGGPTGYLLPSVPQRVPVEAVRKPDWVIVRQSFSAHKDTLMELVKESDYERVPLSGVDTVWGNRPSPYFHHFATPSKGPPIELYRRREGS
jgi:hypothetical protein